MSSLIDRLIEMEHKPAELFADAGYGSDLNILSAQEQGVDLVAPVTSSSPPDPEKMQLSDFEISDDGLKVLACIKDQKPLTCEVTDDGQMPHWCKKSWLASS